MEASQSCDAVRSGSTFVITTMTNCIFCKLISGELPTNKVYEDDIVFAFLDKHPINTGHTLVIPKNHEPDFYKLDDKIYTHLMKIVKRLAIVIDEVIKPKKVGVMVVGLDVPHTHIHVVPLHDGGDITSKATLEGYQSNPSDKELSSMAQSLAAKLGDQSG